MSDVSLKCVLALTNTAFVPLSARSLAQTALRLEEIHQSLHANVYSSVRAMQADRVAQSIQTLKKSNAGLQKQLQTLRQRVRLPSRWLGTNSSDTLTLYVGAGSAMLPLRQQLMDYDSVRRSAECQKKGTPDWERMQQRQQVAEAGLVTLTTDINADLNAIESRRGVDMKNELLTVVACQVRAPTRTHMSHITSAGC